MLKSFTRSHPPSVDIKPRIVPVPEIICSLNEEPEKIRDNIESNIRLGLPQVMPYETQSEKVIGLAGRNLYRCGRVRQEVRAWCPC